MRVKSGFGATETPDNKTSSLRKRFAETLLGTQSAGLIQRFTTPLGALNKLEKLRLSVTKVYVFMFFRTDVLSVQTQSNPASVSCKFK